jgi:methylmalonyl-CoA/ethylmalonyl-CoA epimerase
MTTVLRGAACGHQSGPDPNDVVEVRGYRDAAEEATVLLNLSHIGQIALPVSNVDRAEKFYETVIGLRKLYRFGDLSFFDCAGVRLLLDGSPPHDGSPSHDASPPRQGGVIYFRCADISLTVAELKRRGVFFTHPPHLIARMDDHDLWMAFFDDPDGHTLAVMQEAPKGYAPPAS